MLVAWTGHRPDVFRNPNRARRCVESAAQDLADQGMTRFVVGGQRGVDTWAALAAIARGIPFSVILPCPLAEFTREWTDPDRLLLHRTLAQAHEVAIAGGYAARNRRLVSGADLLVAVWARVAGGGTAETLDLARAAGVPIREIVLEPASAARSSRGRGI